MVKLAVWQHSFINVQLELCKIGLTKSVCLTLTLETKQVLNNYR